MYVPSLTKKAERKIRLIYIFKQATLLTNIQIAL